MFENFPQIKTQEPLSRHCWYSLGGLADYFIEIEDIMELPALIKEAKAHNIPYIVLGGGSNTVFHDDGLRGLVIKTTKCQNIDDKGDGVFELDAGVNTTQFVKSALDKGYTGIESLFGLPGTVGGATFGNAEAHKTSIGDFITNVTLLTNEGEIEEKDAEYFDFSYRHSHLHETHEIVLKITLKLKKLDGLSEEMKQKAFEALNFRKNNQPSGRNNGSFFKNPEGNYAGKLIDEAGLKGTKIGGAYISEKHGNFFMNDGTATTSDLIALKDLAQKEVEAKFGIKLVPEVRIVMSDGTYLNDKNV